MKYESDQHPTQPEQSTPLTSEQLKERLADLTDGEFKVRRSDGTIEAGWSIVGAGIGPDGKLAVGIMKIETNEVKRGIDAQTLLTWQQEAAAEEAPAYYVAPSVETDTLEQARIDKQAFANEVNATSRDRSPENYEAVTTVEQMGPHEEIVARTMGRKAMEDRLGGSPT